MRSARIRHIGLVAAAGSGALLASAFLQTAVAVADTSADITDNAFTAGGLTFDPGSDGYNDFAPFIGLAPLLKIGFGSLGLGTNPSPTQDLEVYDSSGTDIGTAYTSVNGLDLLGINSAQFTVQGLNPPVATVEAALTNSDLDLTGVNASDLANALVASGAFGPEIDYGSGDITASDVMFALLHADITLPATITNAEIADVLNGIDLPAELPDAGTVYSLTNLGGGFANIYQAIPSSDGTGPATITDTFVTPFGSFDVPTSYDATAPMAPGDAFTGFAADNADVSDHAFTLDGTTFDPGTDGFTPVSPLIGVAPLLAIGGGEISLGGTTLPLASQDLEVYGGDGTDLGSVTTSVNVQNLLGFTSTQLTVTDGTAADGGDAAALPDDGTVYSVTNLGSGWANVYVATPNADGTAAGTITDKFVTPWGSFDIPTTYDAIAPLDPGAAFAALGIGSDASGLSDNAFTLGGITFDPGADGFATIAPTAGIAPLLAIGGGSLAGLANLSTQDLDLYGSDGELGSIQTAVNTSDLLGLIDTTQLTVSGYNVPAGDFVSALDNSDINFGGIDTNDLVTALENYASTSLVFHLGGGELTASDITNALYNSDIDLAAAGVDPGDVANVLNEAADAYGADLPELGTVYSVTDFGGGFANVYEAIPNDDGTAAASITDYLVTPFGNIDLSSMFDAIAALDPGDAATGVSDVVGSGVSTGFDLLDPSSWF